MEWSYLKKHVERARREVAKWPAWKRANRIGYIRCRKCGADRDPGAQACCKETQDA